jgi:hypothetical protein
MVHATAAKRNIARTPNYRIDGNRETRTPNGNQRVGKLEVWRIVTVRCADLVLFQFSRTVGLLSLPGADSPERRYELSANPRIAEVLLTALFQVVIVKG